VVEGRLGGYIRMSIPERREAVAELTEEGMSTREIGEVLGVGQSTVDHAQPDPNGSPEPEPQAPSADELIADGDITLRRSRARLMLSKAAAATNQLSPSIKWMVSA